MIQHLAFDSRFDDSSSPFLRSERQRPLRVTFHTSSFDDLPRIEAEALEALSQLSHLSEIEALGTRPSVLPYLEVGNSVDGADWVPVTVMRETGRTVTGVRFPEQWLRIAAKLVNQVDPHHPKVQSAFQDIVTVRSHCSLRRDILVTYSPLLLEHQTDWYIRDANPRTPSDAAKIVGLFLRSRDNYTYYAEEHKTMSLDRGLFYLGLVHHRLPSMWRYLSACGQAEKIRGDDILYLGQSILVRCIRALEARDAVGVQFYLPQNNNTRDAMMYHFEYLLLLLTGAFDAQARVAHRAYGVKRPSEFGADFRKSRFLSGMKTGGGDKLCSLVSSDRFKNIDTLLRKPRNTIHGAGFPPFAVLTEDQQQASFVTVLPNYEQDLRKAAEQCDSLEHWGLLLSPTNELQIEPYTYSVALVDACFEFIDQIASATDITGLFPSGHDVPALPEGPPENRGVFQEDVCRRLAILG
jgi:hypothetical protein